MASIATSEAPRKRILPVTFIENFPFPDYCKASDINFAMNYMPRKGDLVISSYPMAKSTWVLNCIWKLFNMTYQNPDFNTLNDCLVPSMEYYGPQIQNARSNIMRNNLPYSLINRNPYAKYIYVARNPKDVLISYYCYALHDTKDKISFEDFFQDFIEGRLPYGDYFSHVLSWYHQHKRLKNIFFLSYEEMHINPRSTILEIASFLSTKHYKFWLNSIDEILTYTNCDFRLFTIETDSPKNALPELIWKHQCLKHLIESNVHQDLELLRDTGYIGNWRNYLTSKQNRIINNMSYMKFEGTDLIWMMCF